jgi:hypothetical protein
VLELFPEPPSGQLAAKGFTDGEVRDTGVQVPSYFRSDRINWFDDIIYIYSSIDKLGNLCQLQGLLDVLCRQIELCPSVAADPPDITKSLFREPRKDLESRRFTASNSASGTDSERSPGDPLPPANAAPPPSGDLAVAPAQAPEGAAATGGRAGTKADRAKRKKEREDKIAAYLHDHPRADSPEIHKKTRIPESSIRKSDAWKTREKAKELAGSRDAMRRRRPLGESRLAVVPAKSDDPAELAEVHELVELLARLQTDPEFRKSVEREYRQSVDPSQRAAYKRAEPDEQIQILGVWKVTGTPA